CLGEPGSLGRRGWPAAAHRSPSRLRLPFLSRSHLNPSETGMRPDTLAGVLRGSAARLVMPVTLVATASTQEPELATTVDDGFTIAVVGDVIIAHSLGHMMSDPDFARVVEILREADVAAGTSKVTSSTGARCERPRLEVRRRAERGGVAV